MFAYCGNNAPKSFDQSGDYFTFLGGTEEERAQFWQAVEYIKASKEGAKLIQKLSTLDQAFTIQFNHKGDDRFRVTRNGNHAACYIFWDPNSGLLLGDGKSIQSAAMGLAHEMGHAAQFLDGSYDRLRARQFKNDDDISVEADNLLKYEIPISLQLNEPIRLHYAVVKGTKRMPGITDNTGCQLFSFVSNVINRFFGKR